MEVGDSFQRVDPSPLVETGIIGNKALFQQLVFRDFSFAERCILAIPYSYIAIKTSINALFVLRRHDRY